MALAKPTIILRSSGDAVVQPTQSGYGFTMRELVAAIEETKRRTRHQRECPEGIDLYPWYFEGMKQPADGVWKIRWRS